jgi:hypothetical protein
MYALGEAGLPPSVQVSGRGYALEQTVKHDFWAATGFYKDQQSGERIVVKVNRQTRFAFLPLRWIGRRLQRREVRAYRRCTDLPNIPALLGDVTDTGFAHAYVEGGPLTKDKKVPDPFFGELMQLVRELERRGIAYVDSQKPQNILLGDDGKPHLIDFQVSFDATAWWPRWMGSRLLKLFVRGDVYHVLKNKRRFRPDQLTPDEISILNNKGFLHRLHGWVSAPYHWVRKPLMKWLEKSGRVMAEKSK